MRCRLLVDNAARWSCRSAHSLCSWIDSVAVTTTSGLPWSEVSALACAKTLGYMDCSSRMLRIPRGLDANACTCDAAGSGTSDHADVGRAWVTPNRARLGSTP